MLVPSIVKCLPAGTLAIHRPDGFVKGKKRVKRVKNRQLPPINERESKFNDAWKRPK